MEWIVDEKLRGRPYYSDREKINHVLAELDSRYSASVRKIQLIVADVYANPLNIKPIPPQLKLSTQLGIYIVKLLDTQQRQHIEHQDTTAGAVN